MTTEERHGEQKLPLIGRDRFLVNKLAKQVYNVPGTHNMTPLREIARGNEFDVQLEDGYVIRVSIVLDRILPVEDR